MAARLAALGELMLSASTHPGDVTRAYGLGANAFLVKPSSARELFVLMERLRDFWLRSVEFPPK